MSKRLPTARVSSLNNRQKCPGLGEFRARQEGRTESKAANTGSAVGRAIELFHKAEFKRLRDGVIYEPGQLLAQLISEQPSKFPMADMDEAWKLALCYASDPRNKTAVTDEDDGVLVDSLELKVKLTLEPHEDDETGEQIKLDGHTDQVRREMGQLYLWDLKNGKKPKDPRDYTSVHALQLIAYAEGASIHYGKPVMVGGIIRTQGYQWSKRCKWAEGDYGSAPSVFIGAGWRPEQARRALDLIRHQVALMRRKLLYPVPGEHCRYCESSFPECIDQLSRLLAA